MLCILLLTLLAGAEVQARKAFKITEEKTLLPLVPHHQQAPWASYLNTLSQPRDGPPAPAPVDQGLGLIKRGAERRMFSQREIAGWEPQERQVRALEWELQIAYEGRTFFDGWDFFTKKDPTHGLVNYIDGPSAFARGNAFWTGDGKPGIQVDHWSTLPVGTKRDSVRVTTKSLFSGGLIIADVALAPWGCGVWPAIWTLGYEGEWPTTGEMDILEGIQAMRQNYYTIHTLPGCEINQTQGLFTGTVGNTLCDSTKGGSGCTIVSPSYSSFGERLNLAGGGVFAMLWTGEGIKFWDWNRTRIPDDITSGHPTPGTWGLPAAAWDASTCDPEVYFKAQVIVANIDLCGDWAGDLYHTFDYCPGTCAEYVANPTNLNNTIMLLNSIKVYQQSGEAVTTPQADNNNNLTGAGGAVPLNESGASALASPNPTASGVGMPNISADSGAGAGAEDGGLVFRVLAGLVLGVVGIGMVLAVTV